MKRAARIAPGWAGRLAELGLSDPAVLLDEPNPQRRFGGRWQALSKPGLGGRQRWRWELPPGTVGGAFAPVLYVKIYLRTPWREQFDRLRRQAAGHSRAWWEFEQSEALNAAGVSAVRAVAVAEELHGWREVRSAVIFEPAPGDAFDRLWPQLAATSHALTRGTARHALTRRLAEFAARFHRTGLCHRDLYLCHVFWQHEASPDAPEFTLIDLARTHRPQVRHTRWLVKDLAQLDTSARQLGATRADRLRFLRAYAAHSAETAQDRAALRSFARRIAAKSAGILARIARRAESKPRASASGQSTTEPEAAARVPDPSEPAAAARVCSGSNSEAPARGTDHPAGAQP